MDSRPSNAQEKQIPHAQARFLARAFGRKSLTNISTLARMFITGVSPIMLDDLSSGFNIITHVSQRDALNTLTGFSQAEVELAKGHLSCRVRLAWSM